MVEDLYTYKQALDDFKRARSRAAMRRFWATISGESLELLPYAEISSKLRAVSQSNLGLQEVPVNQIIGSVDRNEDFDKYFNPLRDADRHRWANVKTVMTSPGSNGVPPVVLYKIGGIYFVMDGNHRVSIARDLGNEMIEAYVTELKTKVPVGTSLTPQELVLKAAYADFLEDTNLDQIIPGVDFSLNLIDHYPLLQEHIEVHRYYMGIERHQSVSFQEAAKHWYGHIYLPVTDAINAAGLPQSYRGMTLTDLYLYVLDQQATIQQSVGFAIKTENAIDFVAMQDGKPGNPISTNATDPIHTMFGEMTGNQNELIAQEGSDSSDCLFGDILVAVGDFDPDWLGLQQAIMVNRCPEGSIRGVFIDEKDTETSSDSRQALRDEFAQRLEVVGMHGQLTITTGEVTRNLKEQSLLSDLLVLRLRFPPTNALFDRSGSGITELIQWGKRSILLVKEKPMPISHQLLLYDGQPKSKEALFAAAYYASRLQASLTIFTLDNGMPDIEIEVSEAKTYLRKLRLDFHYEIEKGDNFADAVLEQIKKHQPTTLLAGGYHGGLRLGRLFGSSLDTLLGKVDIPMFICQ